MADAKVSEVETLDMVLAVIRGMVLESTGLKAGGAEAEEVTKGEAADDRA